MSVTTINNINTKLIELFDKRLPDGASRHIVFWYDPEQDFVDIINELSLNDADIKIKVVNNDWFATKYLLEYKDKNSNYLVYIPTKKPDNQNNWLLDIALYSREFRTDWESLTLSKLGITDTSLKSLIKEFKPFFDNEQIKRDLKVRLPKNVSKSELVVCMLSVLVKSPLATKEQIIRTVLSAGLIENENIKYKQITKLMNSQVFWDLVTNEYGYSGKQELKYLFWSLNLTAFATQLHDVKIPEDWRSYVTTKPHNCMVFIDNWRSHKNSSKSYIPLIGQAEKELGVQQKLFDWDIENYIDADIFPTIDREIIKHVTQLVTEDSQNTAKAQEILTRRNHPFWYSVYFKNYYQTLEYAITFMSNMKEFDKYDLFTTPKELFVYYTKHYYQIDFAYRKYCLYYSKLKNENKIIFEEINKIVEDTYVKKYLKKLSIKWHELIKDNPNDSWQIDGILQQKHFFQTFIDVELNKNSREKVFVFISDALRYEIAKELKEELTQKRSEVTIQTMQASVPSYTQLGMASLLPNTSIKFSDKNTVLVDGMSSQGSKNRQSILSKTVPDSIVFRWSDFKTMSRDELRPLTNQKRVIYIYHDVIDDTGDERKTEDDVFTAVEKAKKEIKIAIDKIINGLGGHKVIITADHGFSYRRSPVTDIEKLPLPDKDILISHRRFVVTSKEYNVPSTLRLSLRYLGNQKLYAHFPNGHMIFAKQGGGQKFVHGGPLLQEVVLPIITYKNIRKSTADKDQIPQQVDVIDSTENKTITNTVFRLHLFQKEPVGGKVLPRTFTIAIWDADLDQKVSNEKTYTFDNPSKNPEDREIDLTLHLMQANYGKNKKYELRLKKEDGMNYLSIPYKINITFMNDF